MVYVIGVEKTEYNKTLETGRISISEDNIDKYDIRNIEIGDNFYFNIKKEDLIVGPYKITSKCFIIYRDTKNGSESKSQKVYECFFENKSGNFETISISKSLPFKINDIYENEGQKENPENGSDQAVLIIDESNYVFKFSLIRSGHLWEMEVKLSSGVLKDFLNERNKAINYVAMDEDEKALECVRNAISMISSYFFQENCEFLKDIKGGVSIFPKNRSWLIPFWWLKLLHKDFFTDKLKTSTLYKVSGIDGFSRWKPAIRNAIVICDPTGTISSAQTEGRKVYTFLNDEGIQTDFISKDLTYIEINKYFDKYDLIHFIGHGERGWRIAQRRVLAPEKIVLSKKKTKLIVSNSCNTAFFEGNENVVSKLLKCGVDFIVASDMKIPDKSFSDFFISFYKNIFKKQKNVPLSFLETVNLNIEKDKTDWIFFRLFGR